MGEEEVAVHSKRIALKCPACGAGFRAMEWQAGMKCPECGSDEIAPAMLTEGAVDYSIANRRKGYAIEDIRFGKIAQWTGFISPYQYNQALAKQKQIADSGQEAPPIGQVLMSQSVLTDVQVRAILTVYDKPRPDADDREFVEVAVQNKFISKEQGSEVLARQREMKKNSTPPPVSVLMLEQRLMKENQIVAILRAQHKRTMGPIHEVMDVIEQNREPTVLEKYIGKKGDPMRKYRAAAYISVGAFLVLVWAWYWGFLKFSTERAPFYCVECKKTWIGKVRRTVPVKCPYCKKQGGLYGFFCEKCRRAYGLPQREGRKKCTHCGSMLFAVLTEEKMKEHERRIKEELEADQKGVRKSDFKVD